MSGLLNRVYHTSATAGHTTSITLSTAAVTDAFLTMAEAGAVDGELYSYVIEEGTDFEVQRNQTWDATAKTLTRGTPVVSKIGGVAGTTKMTLLGTAAVRVTPAAQDFLAEYQDKQDQLDALEDLIADEIVDANANAIAMAIALG